jgi:glucose-6-phosphate 1-dehydrogenase
VTLEPSLFVIFGATGDLSARKLLPALCKLAAAGILHPKTQVVGLGRGAKTREAFQAWVRDTLAEADLPPAVGGGNLWKGGSEKGPYAN